MDLKLLKLHETMYPRPIFTTSGQSLPHGIRPRGEGVRVGKVIKPVLKKTDSYYWVFVFWAAAPIGDEVL